MVEKVTTTTTVDNNFGKVPGYQTGQRVVEKVTTTTNEGYTPSKPAQPTSGQRYPTNYETSRQPEKNVVTHTNTNYQTPRPSYPPTELNNERLCSCEADRTHSSKQQTTTVGSFQSTTSSFGKPASNSNQYNQQQFTTTTSAGQASFGGITNSMSLLQQLPVFPQAPGYAASYAPDKIPKGAVIAFMPVIILPQSAYEQCDNNAIHTNGNYQQNVDPFPLGVQPAPIPFSFSQITGGARKDQCMCPCSCTQNIPDKLHRKRDVDANEGLNATAIIDNDKETVSLQATEAKETDAINAIGQDEQSKPIAAENKKTETETDVKGESNNVGGVETLTTNTTPAVVEAAEPPATVGKTTTTSNEDAKIEKNENIETPSETVVEVEKRD